MGEWIPAEFLAYLDAAKENAGIDTDAELARRMGKKQQPISTWRKGVQPSPGFLDLAAVALGVPAANLYILAGHRVPGHSGDIDARIVPGEIESLIDLFNEAGRTDEQRAMIRSQARFVLSGLRALFGSAQTDEKVTETQIDAR